MGGETALLFRLVDELADGSRRCASSWAVERLPAEILRIVRRGLPLSVVTGSGGLADRLARRLEGRKADPVAGAGADPAIAEIVADGDIELLGIESDPVAFAAISRVTSARPIPKRVSTISAGRHRCHRTVIRADRQADIGGLARFRP